MYFERMTGIGPNVDVEYVDVTMELPTDTVVINLPNGATILVNGEGIATVDPDGPMVRLVGEDSFPVRNF